MPPHWGPLLERSPVTVRKTRVPSPSAADPAGSPARWKEQQARGMRCGSRGSIKGSLVKSITDCPVRAPLSSLQKAQGDRADGRQRLRSPLLKASAAGRRVSSVTVRVC